MTTQNYAIIENGVVSNVVIWDGNTEAWQPPSGCTVAVVQEGQAVSIGWTYDGTSFSTPVTPQQQ
jgi:hypothetical protein